MLLPADSRIQLQGLQACCMPQLLHHQEGHDCLGAQAGVVGQPAPPEASQAVRGVDGCCTRQGAAVLAATWAHTGRSVQVYSKAQPHGQRCCCSLLVTITQAGRCAIVSVSEMQLADAPSILPLPKPWL
jgi:hypothetical protein